MSNNLSTLKVGDKAIVVSQYKTTEVTVTSVGRKWIVTDFNKFNKIQFSVEDGKENSNFNPQTLKTLEQHEKAETYRKAREAINALGVELNYKATNREELTRRIYEALKDLIPTT